MLTAVQSVDRGGLASVDVERLSEFDGYGRGDLRMRGAPAADTHLSGGVPGAFYPFPVSRKSVLPKDVATILSSTRAKKAVILMLFNFLSTVVLFVWCHTTNSMALTAFTYLTVFDVLSLVTSVLSVWIQHQKHSARYPFGYERLEVLAVFTCSALAQLGSLFIFKESVERIFDQPEVHAGRLLVATTLALTVHLAATYGTENIPFEHVIAACHTSWLQEHVSDVCDSLCHYVPGLSRSMAATRANPLTLLGGAATLTLFGVYVAIDWRNYMAADTIAAMAIALFTCATMFPMSIYCGRILLQTTPTHAVGQLDKCLREACTLDGVLEFRNEHFWTLSFGKLAGSVHVRIRRDANEQLVLAHVASRLSPLVAVLTVQTFKDDWSRQPSQHLLQTAAASAATAWPQAAMLPDITPMKPVFKGRFDVSQDGASFLTAPPPLLYPSSSSMPWTSTPVNSPAR